MKNLNRDNIKKYIIGAILCIIIVLLLVAIIYAFKNYNRDDVLTVNNDNVKFTMSKDQLDNIKQPDVKVDVKYYILPETKSTLEYIKVDTLKKLFQNEKKSLVVVSRDDCSVCKEYLPRLENILNKFGLSAYVINLNDLSSEEIINLLLYVDFDGTPTTYIISNSKVNHVLDGSVDDDTLASFIDYFYVREN